MGHLRLGILFLLLFICFTKIFHAQNKAVTTPARVPASLTRVEVSAQRIALTIPLPPPGRPTPAIMQVTLVDPDDVAWAQTTNNVALRAGQKKITAILLHPFHGLPIEDLKELHWMRLKY